MEETNREELRALSRATREIWAQWEPLELREVVLYLRSPERTPSDKSRIVLPHKLGLFALSESYERTYDISRLG